MVQGEPFKPKKWMEVCDEKIQTFIDKRFKYFEVSSELANQFRGFT